MPVMSARSFAEMINLPMYEQARILFEQKYPKSEPNIFKVPYYKPALDTIKKFYRSNRNGQVLSRALTDMRYKIRNQTRLRHNTRVIQAFRKSAQSRRNLSLTKQIRLSSRLIPNVTLKLYFDIEAVDKNIAVYIFYNFRDAPIDAKVAKDTIKIAYWILYNYNAKSHIKQIEYIDLRNNQVYTVRRPSIIGNRRMVRYAQIVNSVWRTI